MTFQNVINNLLINLFSGFPPKLNPKGSCLGCASLRFSGPPWASLALGAPWASLGLQASSPGTAASRCREQNPVLQCAGSRNFCRIYGGNLGASAALFPDTLKCGLDGVGIVDKQRQRCATNRIGHEGLDTTCPVPTCVCMAHVYPVMFVRCGWCWRRAVNQ